LSENAAKKVGDNLLQVQRKLLFTNMALRKENNNYMTKIRDANKEKESYEIAFKFLCANVAEAKKEKEKTERELCKVTNEFSAMQQSIDDVVRSIDKAKEKKIKIRELAKKDNDELSASIEKTRDEMRMLKARLAEAVRENERISKEGDKMRFLSRNLQVELSTLRDQNSTLQDEVTARGRDRESMVQLVGTELKAICAKMKEMDDLVKDSGNKNFEIAQTKDRIEKQDRVLIDAKARLQAISLESQAYEMQTFQYIAFLDHLKRTQFNHYNSMMTTGQQCRS
jgi:chromosome segregation ATPase